MPQPPAQPKIYHILHIDRLVSVVAAGGLRCDAEMQRRGGGGTTIGMGRIKARRLSLPVACHPGDYVGDYVPFYFCPRSLMLYLNLSGESSGSRLSRRPGSDHPLGGRRSHHRRLGRGACQPLGLHASKCQRVLCSVGQQPVLRDTTYIGDDTTGFADLRE